MARPICNTRVYCDHDGDMDQYEHGKSYMQYSTGDRSAYVSFVRYSDRFNTATLPKQHCMVSKTTCDAANHQCVDRDSKVYKYKLKPPKPPKKCTRLKSTIITNTEDRQYNKWTTNCRNLFCNCKQSNKSSSKAGLEGNDQCNKYTDGKSNRSPSHYMSQYVSADSSSSHYMSQYVSADSSSSHYMPQYVSADSSSSHYMPQYVSADSSSSHYMSQYVSADSSSSHYMPQYVSADSSSSHYMPQYVSADSSSSHYMPQYVSTGSSSSHYMPQFVSANSSSSHYMSQYVSADSSSSHYMSQFASAGSSSDTLSDERTRKALEWTRIKRLLFLVGILLGILVALGVVVGTVVMAPQTNKG